MARPMAPPHREPSTRTVDRAHSSQPGPGLRKCHPISARNHDHQDLRPVESTSWRAPTARSNSTWTPHGPCVEVRSGGYLITAYPKHDLGLRNLAIVTLANSHHSARYVADLFGLSEGQVSRIRSDYDEHGSAGLAKKRGHPPLLNSQQIRQARLWAGQDVRQAEIARRLNVSRSLIGGLLQDHPPLHPDQPLDGDWDTGEPTGSDTTSSLSDPAGIAEQPKEST